MFREAARGWMSPLRPALWRRETVCLKSASADFLSLPDARIFFMNVLRGDRADALRAALLRFCRCLLKAEM